MPSESRPGVEYTVTLGEDGTWSCTCPHYTYRRAECKHIMKVKGGLPAPEPGYFVHPMVRDGAVEDREYQRRLVERLSILAGALECQRARRGSALLLRSCRM